MGSPSEKPANPTDSTPGSAAMLSRIRCLPRSSRSSAGPPGCAEGPVVREPSPSFTGRTSAWLSSGARTRPPRRWLTKPSTTCTCRSRSPSRNGPFQRTCTGTPFARNSAPRRTRFQCSCVAPSGMTPMVSAAGSPAGRSRQDPKAKARQTMVSTVRVGARRAIPSASVWSSQARRILLPSGGRHRGVRWPNFAIWQGKPAAHENKRQVAVERSGRRDYRARSNRTPRAA